MQENCPGSKVNEASRSEDPTQVCFSETQMLDVSAGRSSTSVPSCSSRWNREAQSGEAMELGLCLQVPLRSWLCPVLLSAFYTLAHVIGSRAKAFPAGTAIGRGALLLHCT